LLPLLASNAGTTHDEGMTRTTNLESAEARTVEHSTPLPEVAAVGDLTASIPTFADEWTRVAFVSAGVVLPAFCCLVTYPDNWYGIRAVPALTSWQAMPVLASALLSHKGMLPLYPFLACSMIALWATVLGAERHGHRWYLRAGVYCGVVVAAEYWLLFITALAAEPGPLNSFLVKVLIVCCGTSITTVLVAGVGVLIRIGSKRLPFLTAIVTFLLIPLLPPLVMFVLPFCATTLCLAAYSIVAVRLWRWRRECADGGHFSLAQLLAVVGWFAAHCAAWRLAVQIVLGG